MSQTINYPLCWSFILLLTIGPHITIWLLNAQARMSPPDPEA